MSSRWRGPLARATSASERLLAALTSRVAKQTARAGRERSAVDLVIASFLSGGEVASSLNDGPGFVNFLRGCLEPVRFSLRPLRDADDGQDLPARRFSTLLTALASGVPPLPLARASSIGLVADRLAASQEPFEKATWAGDAGLHFGASSTFGPKGRLLTSAVRFMHPQTCLELGTAYGMSALFILAALDAAGPDGRLLTIEQGEARHSISSGVLGQAHPGRVACHLGRTGDVLPTLLGTDRAVDFVFHDAEHSEQAYVADFEAIEPSLAPGAIVLYDDIRWDDPFRPEVASRTYKGWSTVAAHRRVRRAVEIDGSLGLLLIG